MHIDGSRTMRVLALGAHPDDIEVGCGGTLIKYARGGHRISLMVLTQGEWGAGRGVRKREQERAIKHLHAENLYWGGYRDTEVPNDRGLIRRIERVVRQVDPHFIFVNYHDDTHQDHRHLALSTMTATRYTKNVLFYEGPTSQNFSPTVFVDIDTVLDDKLRAIHAHTSQVKKTNIEGLTILDLTRSSSHFRGIQGRVRNAEGFLPLRMFINITS